MPDDRPLVSVITPTYNRGKNYLRETIESVLNQDYPNFEFIILDDGSTDNTLELVASFDDPRITYSYHDNMGLVRTMNKGFDLAKGEFITAVNSDDPVLPGLITESVKFLQSHPDIALTYPDWTRIDEHSQPIEDIDIPKDYSYIEALGQHVCWFGPGTFFRSEVLAGAGPYDTNFSEISDFEFYLRLGLYGYKFAHITQKLATHRFHSDSITGAIVGDGKVSNQRVEMLDKLYAMPEVPDEWQRVKNRAYGSAHYTTAILSIPDRAFSGHHFFRSIVACPVNCYPFGIPRRWRLMLYIMLSAVLPRFIRTPLGIIKQRLDARARG